AGNDIVRPIYLQLDGDLTILVLGGPDHLERHASGILKRLTACLQDVFYRDHWLGRWENLGLEGSLQFPEGPGDLLTLLEPNHGLAVTSHIWDEGRSPLVDQDGSSLGSEDRHFLSRGLVVAPQGLGQFLVLIVQRFAHFDVR